jgi:hypothetical protein
LPSSSFASSQSFTYPRISPSQAIIRPIPISRLSSSNTNKNSSSSTDIIQSNDHLNPSININTNDRSFYHILSSCSSKNHHDAYVPLNKIDHLIQQESANEKLSSHKNSPYDNVQVGYIDDVEEGSVSLKSSICDSKTSLNTISPQKDDSESSSSSLDFHNDGSHIDEIRLYESTV